MSEIVGLKVSKKNQNSRTKYNSQCKPGKELAKLFEEHFEIQICYALIKRLEGSLDSSIYQFFVLPRRFLRNKPFYLFLLSH